MGQEQHHQPVCNHRSDADETELLTSRSKPDPQHPEDQSSVTIDVNEYHAYANTREEHFNEMMHHAVSKSEEARFTEDEDKHMRYVAKPLHVWLFAGLASVFCLWLQHYIFMHHEDWGSPFGRLSGLVRLALLLLFGYLAFMAWPWRRLVDESSDEQEKLRSTKDSIAEKFHKR